MADTVKIAQSPDLWGIVAALASGTIAGLRKIARAIENRRQATMLASFDDRMLSDIGLTRSDIRDAYAEPLWRDPTDILARRARERRRSRVGTLVTGLGSPSIVPENGFLVPQLDRPARYIV
jgi:uncharacterized protein YjiS (DUF1127 family)